MAFRIARHDTSDVVQLSDGSGWRIWPADVATTLQWFGRRLGDRLPPHRAALLLWDNLLGGFCRHRRHSTDPRLHVRGRAAQNCSTATERGWTVRDRVPAQCRLGHRLGAAFEAVRPDAGRELTADSRP